MTMKRLILLALLTACVMSVDAQEKAKAPDLEYAMQLKVTIGEAFTINNTQHGHRTVIPITGGTFEGPRLKGAILNGGADYQLNKDDRTELEAIYCIKTDDGVVIHVRNRGIIAGDYFKCAPQFEAPADSKYAWLNNALFVCSPDWSQNFQGIVLNVWMVK